MYSKVEIHGGCDVNYLHIKKNIQTTSQINNVVKEGLHLPEWDTDTLMLAGYQNSIDGTPLQLTEGVVVGYQIQRYDVNKDIMKYVAQTPQGKIQDFNVKDGVPYQYYIFPVIKIGDKRILGAPIVTDEIRPSWDMCTIVGLIETEKKNEYIVDPNNIWRLHLNFEPENYTLNMDKTFTDGFDRFSKRTQGVKKYVTSGANSIVGTLECNKNGHGVQIIDMEKWEDFCYSSNLKLFNDMRGRILPIDIETVSTGYLYNGADSPVVTNIKYRQLADANNITVYGLDGE